jgi:hypothetical protein
MYSVPVQKEKERKESRESSAGSHRRAEAETRHSARAHIASPCLVCFPRQQELCLVALAASKMRACHESAHITRHARNSASAAANCATSVSKQRCRWISLRASRSSTKSCWQPIRCCRSHASRSRTPDDSDMGTAFTSVTAVSSLRRGGRRDGALSADFTPLLLLCAHEVGCAVQCPSRDSSVSSRRSSRCCARTRSSCRRCSRRFSIAASMRVTPVVTSADVPSIASLCTSANRFSLHAAIVALSAASSSSNDAAVVGGGVRMVDGLQGEVETAPSRGTTSTQVSAVRSFFGGCGCSEVRMMCAVNVG